MIKPFNIGSEVFWDRSSEETIFEVVACINNKSDQYEEATYNIKNKKNGIIFFNIRHEYLSPTVSALSIDDLLVMHQFYSSMYRVLGEMEYQHKLIVIEEQINYKSKIHKKA